MPLGVDFAIPMPFHFTLDSIVYHGAPEPVCMGYNNAAASSLAFTGW